MIQTQSAGGVFLNKNNQVLVVSQHGTSWSLPKGHLEEGEDISQALKREVYEETGITEFEIVKPLGSYTRHRIDNFGKEDVNEMKTIFMFLLKTDETNTKPIDKENPEMRWINKDKVADLLTHENDKKFYLSIINLID